VAEVSLRVRVKGSEQNSLWLTIFELMNKYWQKSIIGHEPTHTRFRKCRPGLYQAGWQRSSLGSGWKVLSRTACGFKYSAHEQLFIYKSVIYHEQKSVIKVSYIAAQQQRSLLELADDTQEASWAQKITQIESPSHEWWEKGKARKWGKGKEVLMSCCQELSIKDSYCIRKCLKMPF